MSNLYVKSVTTFQVASDNNLNDTRANWSEDFTEATTGSKASKRVAGTATIADSGTLNVDFGEVTTAHFMFLKSDRKVQLKFNGDSTGFSLGHTADEGGAIPFITDATSLSVVNSSGGNATFDYEIVGV